MPKAHGFPQASHFNPVTGELFLGIRGASLESMRTILAHEFGHFLFVSHAAAQNRTPYLSFLALISHYDELFADGFVMVFLMSESVKYFESVKTNYPEDVSEYWRVPEDSWITHLQQQLAPSLLSSQ